MALDSTVPKGNAVAPTIIERRENIPSTIYGNVLDFSGSKDGFVKDVTQEGSLDVGFALLKITTTTGTDLCFAAYRPGNYKTGGLETDALQALVQMNGSNVQTLYLAGGKGLKAGDGAITRSEAGLAYVEKTLAGKYVVGNPSPTAATVTVALPALSGLKAFDLDDQGKHTDPAQVTPGSAGTISIQLKPASRVEFAP